jgi:UPF0755 protein
LRRLLLGLVFLTVVVLVFTQWTKGALKAVDTGGGGHEVSLTIPKGSTAQEIAALLLSKGLIRNQTMWVLAASQGGYTQRFQAGDYTLRPTMSGKEIMEELTHGTVATVKITIPEGSNLKQIAEIVAKSGLTTAKDFEKLTRDPKRWPKTKFPLPKKDLEGYLFPDTYPVDRDAGAEEILAQMLARFGQVYEKHESEIKKNKLSLHEIVTLASIIEREIRAADERPIAAQVFLSRMAEGWPLQSCATVQFILGKPEPILTLEETRTESPYNTYLHKGLPPGPIASPGEPCIEAVLHPAKTDYMFFHTEGDSGRHKFSRTSAEHESTKEQR